MWEICAYVFRRLHRLEKGAFLQLYDKYRWSEEIHERIILKQEEMSVSQLPQKYIAVGEVVKIQKRLNNLYDIKQKMT